MIRSLAFNVFFYARHPADRRDRHRAGADPDAGAAARPAALLGARRRLGHALDRRHEGRVPRPASIFPPRGPVLLANKHHSECDGILLAARIPGIAFVAMQELFRYPLIGAILYRLQMIRVDTCGGGKERENLAQFAKRAYDSGRHIAIYPEGNLMAPGERERYRSGIYYLYRDLDLPVTPVATSVGLLWNRRDWWKKPGRAAIEFLPRDRDRPRQADLHAPPGGDDRDGERPPDRGILRPALYAVASSCCARRARPASASRSPPLAQRLDEVRQADLTLALQPLGRQDRLELDQAGARCRG